MRPQTRGEGGGGVMIAGKEMRKVVMGDAASLWETIHAFVDVDVSFAIGGCGVKAVVLDDR